MTHFQTKLNKTDTILFNFLLEKNPDCNSSSLLRKLIRDEFSREISEN